MKSMTKVLWGLFIITVGMIFAVNALGIANIHLFRGWWTLFIIIPSFIGLFDKNDRGGSLIGLLIGIALLLSAQGFISFSMIMKLIVPFIIICIGFSVLLKGVFGENVKEMVEKNINMDKKDLESIASVMGTEEKIVTGEFKGSTVDAVFGGLTLDLRKAKLGKKTSLVLTSVFGSIDILLPEDVTVKMDSTKVFGGVKCTAGKDGEKASKKEEKIVYIEAVSVFGGITIR